MRSVLGILISIRSNLRFTPKARKRQDRRMASTKPFLILLSMARRLAKAYWQLRTMG